MAHNWHDRLTAVFYSGFPFSEHHTLGERTHGALLCITIRNDVP